MLLIISIFIGLILLLILVCDKPRGTKFFDHLVARMFDAFSGKHMGTVSRIVYIILAISMAFFLVLLFGRL